MEQEQEKEKTASSRRKSSFVVHAVAKCICKNVPSTVPSSCMCALDAAGFDRAANRSHDCNDGRSEHKCQYCCAAATWFCWGKAHFCVNCHDRQLRGDYVSRYPREKLPVCPGRELCPLKIEHPPNGTPFALGCIICRQEQQF